VSGSVRPHSIQADIWAMKQDNDTIDPFLTQIHALVAYSQAHKSVIKSRDQKQLDFEELSAYLSAVVAERDRMAALNNGHTSAPVGLTTYLRDQVDKLRGTDDIHTRRERIRKMDGKIKEVRDSRLLDLSQELLTAELFSLLPVNSCKKL
jgi:hypothetical protein